MYIHGTTCIYFPSCSYLIRITFLFAMQVAEAEPGEEVHDIAVWQRMKMKKPDLEKPQPQLPEYFGSSEEDLRSYCSTVQGFYPELDDPIHAETDETSLILSGHGRQHGRLRVLNAVVKPTTSFTRLKATLPAGSPPIPPPRRPRRSTSTHDVSFPHFHPLSDFRSCMAELTRFIVFEIVA